MVRQVCSYPFDGLPDGQSDAAYSGSPDDPMFRAVCLRYADAASYMREVCACVRARAGALASALQPCAPDPCNMRPVQRATVAMRDRCNTRPLQRATVATRNPPPQRAPRGATCSMSASESCQDSPSPAPARSADADRSSTTTRFSDLLIALERPINSASVTY